MHGCAHKVHESQSAFDSSELIYERPSSICGAPAHAKHRYRFDYEEVDHVELLEWPQEGASPGDGLAVWLGAVRGAPSRVSVRVALQVMNHAGVRIRVIVDELRPGPAALGPQCGEELRRPSAHQAQGTELRPALDGAALPLGERLAVMEAMMATWRPRGNPVAIGEGEQVLAASGVRSH